MHITGLLSSLGVRGSCWLVSIVSESCSDTAKKPNKQNKLRNWVMTTFFSPTILSINHRNTYVLYESFWRELPPTHFVPFRAKHFVVKPLMYTFKLSDKAVNHDSKQSGTDGRSEPLQSFHLEHLAADVSVALRVFLWPTTAKTTC